METTKNFLTTKEVMELYGFSRQTLDRRAEEGEISKYRFGDNGRTIYWSRVEIDSLFKKEE